MAQSPIELAASDIDGVDPTRATTEQHVGEAAGRGADIERDLPFDRNLEMVERVRELDAAARHPGMVAPAPHLESRIGAKQTSRLVDPLLAAEYGAGHDQRLSVGAAFGQAALDQLDIGAPFGHRRSQHRAGRRQGVFREFGNQVVVRFIDGVGAVETNRDRIC